MEAEKENTTFQTEVNASLKSYPMPFHKYRGVIDQNEFWQLMLHVDSQTGISTRDYLYLRDYAMLACNVVKLPTIASIEYFTPQSTFGFFCVGKKYCYIFTQDSQDHVIAHSDSGLCTWNKEHASNMMIGWMHLSNQFRVYEMGAFSNFLLYHAPKFNRGLFTYGNLSYNAFLYMLHPLAILFWVFVLRRHPYLLDDPRISAFFVSYRHIFHDVVDSLNDWYTAFGCAHCLIWKNSEFKRDCLDQHDSSNIVHVELLFIDSRITSARQWLTVADSWLREREYLSINSVDEWKSSGWCIDC